MALHHRAAGLLLIRRRAWAPPAHCRVGIAIICLWAVAWPAAAQVVTGSIAGVVRADTGDPLAGATVVVTNPATGLTRSGSADGSGRYVIGGLPVEGGYDVHVESIGFAALDRTGVVLVPGEATVLDVTLRVAAAETVTVSRPAGVSEGVRPTLEQRIDEQMARALPLFGRNFLQLASLAAGFTGTPDYPDPQGQRYWANNVLVDGASHFSKWRGAARAFYSGYGLESIREVRVLTNAFSAEYGDALASITSAITKAGTNEWHGSALIFGRGSALNARPALADRTPPAQGQQFGATLGGPLVRGRTHFFGSYEGRRTRDRNVVVSPAAAGALVPDRQDEQLAFFRLDHQAGARHTLSGRYNAQRLRWHHEPGGLVLPGSGTSYANDVQTVLVTDAAQPSDRVLSETRVQFAGYTDERRDLRPDVYIARAGYSVEGGTLGPTGFGASPERTWEAHDTVSIWRGGHDLAVGGGGRHVRAHNESMAYGYGAYFFAGGPAAFPQPYLFMQGLARTARSTAADPRSISAFGFAQDDWRLRSDLTVNLGVRYDVEKVSGVLGYHVPADRNNVQPRVGVAWNPDRSGRLVIRAGGGLYTQQQLLYPINRVQLEGADGVQLVSLPAGAAGFPAFPAPLPAASPLDVLLPRDVQRVEPGLRNPSSRQYAVGAERVVRGTALAVDWVWLDGRDLLSLVDANAPASITKPAQRSVAAADATRPLVPAPGTYRKVITLGNEGRSWYRAVQVKARRGTGPVQAMVTYTRARAEDMANYELPEDSRNLAAEKGRAQTDVRHSLAAGATWLLPGHGRLRRGWSLSGIGIVRSNRPYNVTWGDDRNGTTQNDARPGARNTGRTDAYASVDVALRRLFPVRRANLEARVEAFNLLNTVNYDRYVGELSSPLFGQPVSAFPPRSLQLAAVLRF
jgi:outer membrane receptor protein involved in Fe transport